MSMAIAKARDGVAAGQTPFGACIVRGCEVVALAHNTVWGTTDITAHAEVNAIREACRALGRFHLEDCELYTSCEPCPMCLGAIYWSRLKAVHYAATRADAAAAGFDDARIYAEQALAPEGRAVPFLKAEAAPAVAVMRAWCEDAAKRPY